MQHHDFLGCDHAASKFASVTLQSKGGVVVGVLGNSFSVGVVDDSQPLPR